MAAMSWVIMSVSTQMQIERIDDAYPTEFTGFDRTGVVPPRCLTLRVGKLTRVKVRAEAAEEDVEAVRRGRLESEGDGVA